MEPFSPDGYMVPGQGYWIFMKDEGIYGSIEKVYQNLEIAQNDDGDGHWTRPRTISRETIEL